MISSQTAVTALSSLVSLLALWCLYWAGYRDYRVDRLRHDLFALRDELFDRAAAGLVPFDSPAYELLRSMLNGSIRFAHKLSFSRIVLFAFLTRRNAATLEAQSFKTRWRRASAGIPEATQKELHGYIERMHTLILKHVFYNSPMFLLAVATVVTPVLLLLLWGAVRRRVNRALVEPFEAMDSLALAAGN